VIQHIGWQWAAHTYFGPAMASILEDFPPVKNPINHDDYSNKLMAHFLGM
jgi:hypothetical protein